MSHLLCGPWRFLRQMFALLLPLHRIWLLLEVVQAIQLPDFTERDPCDARIGIQHLAELGPIAPYIDLGFFTDYKLQTWMYYIHNITWSLGLDIGTISFLWLNTIAFANKEYILQSCPEAYMLSLVVRAEERLPLVETADPLLDLSLVLMSLNGLALDHSAAGGNPQQPPPIDFRKTTWPIQLGLERVQKLNSAHFKAVKTNVPSVGLVLPYCGEDLAPLLHATAGADPAVGVPLRHVTLYLYRPKSGRGVGASAAEGPSPGGASHPIASGQSARYLVRGGDWHTNCSGVDTVPGVEILSRHFRRVVLVDDVESRPEEWEVKRYFAHMHAYYDALDHYTVFAHPDLLEHVHFRSLRNLLQALMLGNFGVDRAATEVVPEQQRVQQDREDASGSGELISRLKPSAAHYWSDFLTLSHHYLHNYGRLAPTRVSDCSASNAREEYVQLLRDLEFDLDLLALEVDKMNAQLFQKYTQPPEYTAVIGGQIGSGDEGTTSAEHAAVIRGSRLVPLSFYCCSQFVVHKSRVRRLERTWYERRIEAGGNTKWNHCLTSYMEVIWPLLFGSERDYLKRQDRPELPLYLRVDNFNEENTQRMV